MSSEEHSQPEGRLYALFPFSRKDLRMLIPMSLMVFFVCFNYSLLRNLKDTVVVTAVASGAEVIPFIKVWFVFPMAVVLTVIFTKLSNRYTQERVFYIFISGFLIIYALFAYVCYPLSDVIHPHHTADYLQSILPAGFSGLIAAFRYWSFTVFYVMCELWSSIVLTVLFWGFANEVTKVSEARYYYSFLGVFSNIAAIIAGSIGIYFSNLTFNSDLPFGNTAWEQTLIEIVSITIIFGILTMLVFRWMNCKVLNDPVFEDLHKASKPAKKKQKISLRESLSFLSQSKYLLCIAVLVVAYNFSINIVEVIWKDKLYGLYPDPIDFNIYLNEVTRMVGIISTIISLFMGYMIGRCGWTWTALITPVTLLITSIGFFVFMFWSSQLADITFAIAGMTPLAIVVFFGGAHNSLSKAMKYSVYDATKEMAFIPLSHEWKLKGKAAIDGIGSRFGKLGGSAVLQGFLILFGSLSASAPYIAVVLLAVIVIWVIVIKSLGKQFVKLTLEKEEGERTEPEPLPETVQPELAVLN